MAVAKEIGLDMAKLEKDLKSDEIEATLQESAARRGRPGLNGTPSYVINNDVVVGEWARGPRGEDPGRAGTGRPAAKDVARPWRPTAGRQTISTKPGVERMTYPRAGEAARRDRTHRNRGRARGLACAHRARQSVTHVGGGWRACAGRSAVVPAVVRRRREASGRRHLADGRHRRIARPQPGRQAVRRVSAAEVQGRRHRC